MRFVKFSVVRRSQRWAGSPERDTKMTDPYTSFAKLEQSEFARSAGWEKFGRQIYFPLTCFKGLIICKLEVKV